MKNPQKWRKKSETTETRGTKYFSTSIFFFIVKFLEFGIIYLISCLVYGLQHGTCEHSQRDHLQKGREKKVDRKITVRLNFCNQRLD